MDIRATSLAYCLCSVALRCLVSSLVNRFGSFVVDSCGASAASVLMFCVLR
jgi:hypothetical protein